MQTMHQNYRREVDPRKPFQPLFHGTFEHTVEVGGSRRRCLVYIPEGARPSAADAFVLPENGKTADDLWRDSRRRMIADTDETHRWNIKKGQIGMPAWIINDPDIPTGTDNGTADYMEALLRHHREWTTDGAGYHDLCSDRGSSLRTKPGKRGLSRLRQLHSRQLCGACQPYAAPDPERFSLPAAPPDERPGRRSAAPKDPVADLGMSIRELPEITGRKEGEVPIWMFGGEQESWLLPAISTNDHDTGDSIRIWRSIDHMEPALPENWEDGWTVHDRWHDLAYHRENGAPMVRYTWVEHMPHAAMTEMSFRIWEEFFSKFSKADGKVIYCPS